MPTPAKVDLRALIQDRKAKDSRPTVRATICFDPDLLDQLRDAEADRIGRRRNDDEPDPDPRLGKKDAAAALVADLEAAVEASSVIAVFRVPARERQAELNKLAEDGEDIDVLMVSECFLHFLRSNEPVPATDLGRSDLDDWLTVASRGEVNDISYRIAARSLGTPDFPLSVMRSLQSRK